MSITDPTRETERLERLSAKDLIQAWRQYSGIDVTHLFSGTDQI